MSAGDSHTPTGMKQPEACYLFSPEKLTKLSKWSEISAQLKQRNLQARPLKSDDYDNGYLELLAQLTKVGHIERSDFMLRFNSMKLINDSFEHYMIVVIEDLESNKIVGASTLFLEMKYIHECAICGRCEDVAVLDTYRGKQIGELVVRIIVELAREVYNCYKITLSCKDELKKFYSKNNFTWSSNMLAIYFD